MTLPDRLPDGRPIHKGSFGARMFSGAMDGTGPPLVDKRLGGARLIGDMTMLDLGCLVWSQQRRILKGSDDTPLGGIVVSKAEQLDQETGEVVRTFVTVDPYSTRPTLKVCRLTPAEIDRETMEFPQDGLVRSLVRRFAEEISKSKGPLTPRLIEVDRWQHNLVRVLVPAGATA